MAVVSDAVREALIDIDVKNAVNALMTGTYLRKYCYARFRKPHYLFFWVDMETLALKWKSPKKKYWRTQIFLADVERIVPGVDSDFWRKKSSTERQLGIELLCHGRKLRLCCTELQEWKVWLRGLLYVHQKAAVKRRRATSLTNDFIMKQWALADLDKNGSMSFYELVHLLQRLNCRADIRYAERLFEQFDADGSSVLEFDEFKQLIHTLLTHEALMDYFEQYKDKKTDTLTERGFRAFLLRVQHTPEHLLEEQVQAMYTLGNPFLNGDGLTNIGFNMLLTSEFNSLMNPAKSALSIADMNCPITQYWISSSHNTYLTRDQMIGKSAVGQYIDVLLKGCRCVELDCWDGNDGEPIIYHGHTLTTKIPFAAVVKACRDYAFQKSPYPVILSLEMHCSTKQKKRVGEILREYLGESIYRHPAGAPVPSPQELQKRFLVKGRVPNESGEEMEEGNENDLLLDEEELQLELLSDYPIDYCSNIPIQAVCGDLKSASGTELPAVSSVRDDASKPAKSAAAKQQPVSVASSASTYLTDYYATICLTGRQLTSFTKDKRGNMDICSLNEKRFSKLARSHSKELAAFHKKYFSRVYPSGTRIMSSNFNPMHCWLYGSQMAALNFQALGLATLLNLGRFLENGEVGYVLKPAILRQPNYQFDPSAPPEATLHRMVQEHPVRLTLQVLAAQQLPRPSLEQRWNRKRDTACPYVVVWMQGLKKDTLVRKTAYVPNNGLNPHWSNQMFVLDVTVPSVSILAFEVRHYDTVGSDFLAGAAVPVSCIRPGVRWVSLYDSKLRQIQWSGLLVRVTLAPMPLSQESHLNTGIQSTSEG